jgi:hypothetical protein
MRIHNAMASDRERCQHPDSWFDRAICPEPCGSAHNRCSRCGSAVNGCIFEEGMSEPQAKPGMHIPDRDSA